MKFSIIFPFKERWEFFMTLFESLERHTHDKKNIELIVGMDNNDIATIKKVVGIKSDIKIDVLLNNPTIDLVNDIWNPLAHSSTGRFILCLNDDAEILTHNWDLIAYTKLNEYSKRSGDDIWLGVTEDKCGTHFSVWTLTSREALEVLGYFFYPKFKVWGGDQHIHEVYSNLHRLVPLSEIIIAHNSHRNNNRELNDSDRRMIKIATATNYDLNIENDIMSQVRILRDYCIAKNNTAFNRLLSSGIK